jgi:hypothetical protein
VNTFTALSISAVPMNIPSDSGVMKNPITWTSVVDVNAIGGTYSLNQVGAVEPMSLTFEGSALEVVYLGGPSFGSFQVELDGVVVQTVNAALPEMTYGLSVSLPNLSAGAHTVRVVPLSGQVAIDGFFILPPTPVTVTATPTLEITPEVVVTTPAPTLEVTVVPTEEVTAIPTEVPTEVPTEIPTEVPTEVPTEAPTAVPTEVPTEAPTEVPTDVPTETPAA